MKTKEISRKLISIGIRKVSDLKNGNPDKLYEKLEKKTGTHIDRCVLYVFRAAVYYATTRSWAGGFLPDPVLTLVPLPVACTLTAMFLCGLAALFVVRLEPPANPD